MSPQDKPQPLHFVVIVLGDLGRSPRMQYHVLSLLELGDHVRVSFVGYTGEALVDALEGFPNNNRLDVIRFEVPSPPAYLTKYRLLYFLWRLVTLSLWLLWKLLVSVRSSTHQNNSHDDQDQVTCILVQNPPATPLLLIALLFTRIKGLTQKKRPRLVIDWHNLGFSMLQGGSLRRIAKAFEFQIAPFADGHLSVTAAMKDFLLRETNINDNSISVLYDCPPSMFTSLELSEQHDVMQKLHQELCSALPRSWNLHSLDTQIETILTAKTGDQSYEPRRGRPALVTSSTSWTADEDFGILLEALLILDDTIHTKASTLKVLVAITGKGPLKEFYEQKISQLKLSSVAVQTVWLEPSDYPRLLACADLGISLHTSTSGLDLPMKVLDLAGCQVPVCALDFDCLSELVLDKHNGRTFKTASELADQLWSLLSPLADKANAANHSYGDLAVYAQNLKGRRRWQENWTQNALPILLGQQP
jgi:beta-1,4-mannosyltransferase